MQHLQHLEYEEKFYSQGFAPTRKGHSSKQIKHKKRGNRGGGNQQDRPYQDAAAFSQSHRKLFKKDRLKNCDWKQMSASDNSPAVASSASSLCYGYVVDPAEDLVFCHDDWDYDISTYVPPTQYTSSPSLYSSRPTKAVVKRTPPPPPPPNPMEMGLEALRRYVANIVDFTPEHYELLTRLHELDKVVISASDDVLSKLSKMTFEGILTKVAEGQEFPGFTPECRICLDEYEATSGLLILPCGHFFHDDCVKDYLQKYNNSCPVCKKEVGGSSTDDDIECKEEEELPQQIQPAPSTTSVSSN